MSPRTIALALLLACSSCGRAEPRSPPIPDATVVAMDGSPRRVRELVGRASFTVLFFFSPQCPVQIAHDRRLVELAGAYRARGVELIGVDSEAEATPERDLSEATRRGYPFPIVLDRAGALADALGAEFSTFTVVVDREGRVRYRGGIDSDRSRLHDDAKRYVADALDDLLAGRPVRSPETKAMGCALPR